VCVCVCVYVTALNSASVYSRNLTLRSCFERGGSKNTPERASRWKQKPRGGGKSANTFSKFEVLLGHQCTEYSRTS